MIEIQRDVPIPEKRSREKRELRLAVEQMEIGDSILVPAQYLNKSGMFTYTSQLGKAIGIKLRQRKTEEGTRIWRIA
jgi:hypothetical protein